MGCRKKFASNGEKRRTLRDAASPKGEAAQPQAYQPDDANVVHPDHHVVDQPLVQDAIEILCDVRVEGPDQPAISRLLQMGDGVVDAAALAGTPSSCR